MASAPKASGAAPTTCWSVPVPSLTLTRTAPFSLVTTRPSRKKAMWVGLQQPLKPVTATADLPHEYSRSPSKV